MNTGNVEQRVSDSKKANLDFSVARVRRYMRGHFGSNYRIRKSAAVMLAGTLEHLTFEVLDLCAEAARANNRVTIKPRHFKLAILQDEELKSLAPNLAIREASNVLPNIHPSLLQSKRKYNKRK